MGTLRYVLEWLTWAGISPGELLAFAGGAASPWIAIRHLDRRVGRLEVEVFPLPVTAIVSPKR